MDEPRTLHGNRNGETHGLITMKRALRQLGSRAVDGRTTLERSLAKWRADIESDLGGANTISTQQRMLVDLAVKSKLLLDSVDAWLLTQKTLVNSRKKSLLPVVLQRAAIGGWPRKILVAVRT